VREATTIKANTLQSVRENQTDASSANSHPHPDNPSATEQRDKVHPRHLTLVPPIADDTPPRPRRMRATIALLLAAGRTLPPA